MQTDQWSTAHFTGTKINKVRWLPRYDQIGRASFFATGTWEEEVNKVTLWQLNLPEGDDNGADAPFECYESTHHGGVTDLKAVEANNQVYVLTTSTKGSYSLYQVPQDLFTGDVDEGQVASLPRELLASNLHTSAATAIDYSPELQEVVTVGEDGTINNLQLTATKPHVSFVRAESCAFTSVQYMTQTTILTTASNNTLKIWDLRAKSVFKQLKDTTKEGIITSATRHPFQIHRLTTAYSNGSIAMWDLRQNAPFMHLDKHTSHVWEVQHHATAPDNLFTCSEDGFLFHWDVKAIQQVSGRGASQLVANDEVIEEVGNSRRVVVTDKLGINSFHVNPETNVLVSAGDTHSLQFRSSVVLQY
jgi:nuclear pore complex protein Nup43